MLRDTRYALSSLLAACGAPQPAVPDLTPAPAPPPLEARVAAARQGTTAPALAAVVVSCTSLATAVDGQRALDRPDQVGSDDHWAIGSNAKSMVATLAAILVEEGVLRWDMTLPELFGTDGGRIHPTLRTATLEQLLSHGAGLAAFTSPHEVDRVVLPPGTGRARRLAFALTVMAQEPPWPPGDGFHYSNAGYVVAGAALERITDTAFEALMESRLFGPLGMTAGFGDPTTRGPDQPLGHYTRDGTHQAYRLDEPVIPLFLRPAGDVHLTPAAYGRFLQLHLCGLQGRDSPVLASRSIVHLHTPRTGDAGLGWGRAELEGAAASVHVGGTGAFSSFMAIIPSRDLAVATIVNSGDDGARAAALALLRALLRAPTR